MTIAVAARPRLTPLTEEAVFVARSLRHSLRDVEGLVMAVALPVMLMLLFTFVFGGAMDPSGHYVDYVVPGIILVCAGFGASGTAVSVSQDMTRGVIDRFRTMPIRAGAVLTGHIAASLIRNLVATAVVLLIGLCVGFRPSGTPAEWLLALALVAAYILAITTLFATIGLAAASPEAASGYGFALLFLPYLSSAFVPIDTMPGWLQPVAEHLPVTPIIDAIRALLLGGPLDGWDVLWSLVWCAGIVLVAAVWGGWLFRRKAGAR